MDGEKQNAKQEKKRYRKLLVLMKVDERVNDNLFLNTKFWEYYTPKSAWRKRKRKAESKDKLVRNDNQVTSPSRANYTTDARPIEPRVSYDYKRNIKDLILVIEKEISKMQKSEVCELRRRGVMSSMT